MADVLPIFNGSMQPDITFVGFPITPAAAVGSAGNPGYFVVIQEHPTEPRFGVAAGSTTAVTPGATSSDTAVQFLRRPVRIAIHARDLLKEAAQ